MICSVMQPTFLPWLGYFDLIDQADHFVFYDDVQFVKQSWQTRNRIKTANGLSYINLPVLKKELGANINVIEIDNSKPWSEKLLKTIFYTYQKSPYFKDVFPFIKGLLNREYTALSQLNITLIESISLGIGIETKFNRSANLQSIDNRKDLRLVDICKELNCNTYLSTSGAATYIEENNSGGAFSKHNITLYYHNYAPIIYHQSFGNFEPYLSIVDLLFNCGFKGSLNIIRSGRKPFLTSNEI